MAPSTVARKNDWFITPWRIEKEDPKHMLVQGKDGNEEVLRSVLTALSDLDKNGVSTSNLVDLEISNVLEDDIDVVP